MYWPPWKETREKEGENHSTRKFLIKKKALNSLFLPFVNEKAKQKEIQRHSKQTSTDQLKNFIKIILSSDNIIDRDKESNAEIFYSSVFFFFS